MRQCGSIKFGAPAFANSAKKKFARSALRLCATSLYAALNAAVTAWTVACSQSYFSRPIRWQIWKVQALRFVSIWMFSDYLLWSTTPESRQPGTACLRISFAPFAASDVGLPLVWPCPTAPLTAYSFRRTRALESPDRTARHKWAARLAGAAVQCRPTPVARNLLRHPEQDLSESSPKPQ